MTVEEKKKRGLSPSSFATFLSCQRKYFHKKISKTPQDSDAPEDYEAFEVGKWFHRCLEVARHEVAGMSFDMIMKIGEEFAVKDYEATGPMIFAMLMSYRSIHEKSGLKAVMCEVEIEVPEFFGIVDAVMTDSDGGWWIVDMKTAATFQSMIIPSLPRHPQLNLYALHRYYLENLMGDLDPNRFMGCRYRLTTKSKIVRGKNKETGEPESLGKFIQRLFNSVKSYDFILPCAMLDPGGIGKIHESVGKFVGKCNTPESINLYPQNYGNCLSYFRPCEFWSQCYGGKTYSSELGIDCIVSES